MMRVTTTFLRGEVAASTRERKKSFPSWKQQEAGQKQNFKKGGFRNQQCQTFSLESAISFSPLGVEDGMEGPMIIEAEIGGHFVHCMYVDGGSSSKILYEHCFNRFRPEVKSQMVPATTPLVGFSGEIIWPLGQISLLVKIGDEEHLTSAWMNFMIDYSIRMYNGFRTRNTVAHNQPSHRRKDSGSDPPRIFKANYSNRLHFDRRSAEGAMRPAKVQPRYIRLEASRYD
nr:reverse transcriptase domain-containing protein [Tanacetum cinerariifolium]